MSATATFFTALNELVDVGGAVPCWDRSGRYLRRALDAGRLARPKRGVYTPVRSVRSVRSGMESGYETDTPDTTDTTPRENHNDREIPGKCADCGEYWPEGTPIRHVDEGWVHDACSDPLTDVLRPPLPRYTLARACPEHQEDQ